jgi:hypothetical protein
MTKMKPLEGHEYIVTGLIQQVAEEVFVKELTRHQVATILDNIASDMYTFVCEHVDKVLRGNMSEN